MRVVLLVLLLSGCGKAVEPTRIERIEDEKLSCYRLSDWASWYWVCKEKP
jgi:hypothetical protein